MKIRSTFKHMESSPSLEQRVEEKISRVAEKYLFSITDVHVTFSVEHQKHKVDCHILAKNHIDEHVSVEADHMYDAIEGMADKLDARLKRLKEKSSDKRHQSIREIPYDSILDQEPIDAAELLKK